MAKFSVVLPDEIYADLKRWAAREKRPVANLAAYWLETAVRQQNPDKYPMPPDPKQP